MKLHRILAALLFAVTGAAHAADYPTRPVTVVVPFPAGGSTDNIARVISAKMSEKFGQAFPVENKPGATGSIGAAQVARSKPDGYTLFVSSLAPFVVNPHLQKKLQYDPTKDFDLITVAVQAPNVLVAGPSAKGGNSLKEVVTYLKAHPDEVTFASSGNGSSDHLTAELFWQETGTKGVHVPYKGGAPAQADLMGGQVQYSFQNINAVIGHIKAGKMKALAVTSEKRSPLLPDVPTMAEAGVKNVVVNSWQAFAAPKGLPADVRQKLHDGVIEAMKDPKIKENLLGVGFEIVGNSPEQFEKFQADELARWKRVIETAGIEAS